MDKRKKVAANNKFQIDKISYSKDNSMVNQALIFQIKFCGKSLTICVATKNYT